MPWHREATNRFEEFCRGAVGEADLVFAHNAAVVERFQRQWDARRCYQFDRSFVTNAIVISDDELRQRERDLVDASRPLRLVAAGRQIRIKGTDQVLRAMRAAIDGGARLELDVMGDGEDLPEFRKLAAELKLDDVVTFAGTVPYGAALFERWAKAQVMVVTNLTAEISRNVLLSMARGLPLVTYQNPGTDALIRDSGAGILVPTGDVDALAAALRRAFDNRAALAEMMRRGVETARNKTLESTHGVRAQLAASLFPENFPNRSRQERDESPAQQNV